MLNIDCLVKNTDFIEGAKKYIKYLGNLHAESGKSASFESVFHQLRKDGVELDIETAGQLYINELPVGKDSNFSSREEVEEKAGQEFDETAKNLLLSKPKTGEQEIGNLSPRKYIAKKLADAFDNKVVTDERTKTILKTIQDTYSKTLDKYTTPVEGKTVKPTDKPFEQLFEEGLDRMNVGHRDTATGLLHNLSTLHEGVKKELKTLTDKLEAEGDPVKAEQWKRHVADFQDSLYTLALTTKESKEAVEKALRSRGFEKVTEDGRKVTDWNKLAGNTNSVEQLRDHVIAALTDSKTGKFDKETAEKVANALQKQYLDLYARGLEISDKQQNKLKDSWAPPAGPKTKLPINEVIADAVKKWENYIGYEGRGNAPLLLAKKDAADAMRHILVEAGLTDKPKNSLDYEKRSANFDRDKLSQAITSPLDIKKIATDYFKNQKNDDGSQKYNAGNVERLAKAMDGMYYDIFNKVREHVEGKQKAIEHSWDNTASLNSQKTTSDIIAQRLKDWSQYKKITSKPDEPLRFTRSEAQRIGGEMLKNSEQYGKESANGTKSINWQEMAEARPTETEFNKLMQDHLVDKEGFSKSDAAEVAKSITRDYHGELDQAITDHANTILENKQKAIDRDTPERKTAIHRLAELTSLGIFDKAHEKLLYHVLGVDSANAEDIQSLKEIADTVTQLKRETGGKEYLSSFAYQNADRLASKLINRNKDDKSRLLKITRVIKNIYGLANMTLISNPFNLLENNWSGQSAIMGSKSELLEQMGKDAAKFGNRKLWWAVFKDVAIGGVDYGGAGDKWAHLGSSIDNLNSLNFKKNTGKAIATSILLPFRALLNGSDAANKAILHHNGMLLMMHKALTQEGWGKEEATHFLYESLYGDNFEQAKSDAAQLIEKYGKKLGIGQSDYAKQRATIRWANDLVKANLNMSGTASIYGSKPPVTTELIESALNSSFHAAAISMGHEANNPFSRMLHAGKADAMHRETELIERGKYTAAAGQRVLNTVYYDGIMRMMGGGANWAVLRAEGLGLGLTTAFGGDLHESLNFENKEVLTKTMEDRITASRKMTRALMGITQSALAVAAIASYGALRKKEDDEDSGEGSFQSGTQGIQKSYVLNRAMNKTGPDAAVIAYLIASSQGEGEGAAIHGALKYAENLINSNPQFTIGGHISSAIRNTAKGSEKGTELAAGELGKLVSDVFIPGLPIYKPYKQFYELGEHYTTGKPIEHPFTKPHSVAQGMVMGGFVQDFMNNILGPAWMEKHGYEDWEY